MTAGTKTKRARVKKRKPPRRSAADVDDFPFPYRWWKGDPYVRALTREERGGLMDAFAMTRDTKDAFRMTEDDLRVWSGYAETTSEEWAGHRTAYLRLFRVEPGGLWVQPVLRTFYIAQITRIREARARMKEKAQKRWADAALRVSGDAAGMRTHMRTHMRGDMPQCSSESSGNRTPLPRSDSDVGSPTAPDVLLAAAPLALVQGAVAGMGRSGSGA